MRGCTRSHWELKMHAIPRSAGRAQRLQSCRHIGTGKPLHATTGWSMRLVEGTTSFRAYEENFRDYQCRQPSPSRWVKIGRSGSSARHHFLENEIGILPGLIKYSHPIVYTSYECLICAPLVSVARAGILYGVLRFPRPAKAR